MELKGLKVEKGSIVEYETIEDGWTKSATVTEVKDNKCTLWNGKTFDINQLYPKINDELTPSIFQIVWVIKNEKGSDKDGKEN